MKRASTGFVVGTIFRTAFDVQNVAAMAVAVGGSLALGKLYQRQRLERRRRQRHNSIPTLPCLATYLVANLTIVAVRNPKLFFAYSLWSCLFRMENVRCKIHRIGYLLGLWFISCLPSAGMLVVEENCRWCFLSWVLSELAFGGLWMQAQAEREVIRLVDRTVQVAFLVYGFVAGFLANHGTLNVASAHNMQHVDTTNNVTTMESVFEYLVAGSVQYMVDLARSPHRPLPYVFLSDFSGAFSGAVSLHHEVLFFGGGVVFGYILHATVVGKLKLQQQTRDSAIDSIQDAMRRWIRQQEIKLNRSVLRSVANHHCGPGNSLANSHKEGEEDEEPPSEVTCPITLQVMKDPVIALDGHTYERCAIEQHFQSRRTSPMTNAHLPSRQLIPNVVVRSLCRDYQEAMSPGRQATTCSF